MPVVSKRAVGLVTGVVASGGNIGPLVFQVRLGDGGASIAAFGLVPIVSKRAVGLVTGVERLAHWCSKEGCRKRWCKLYVWEQNLIPCTGARAMAVASVSSFRTCALDWYHI